MRPRQVRGQIRRKDGLLNTATAAAVTPDADQPALSRWTSGLVRVGLAVLVVGLAIRIVTLWTDPEVAWFWIEPVAMAAHVWSGPPETGLAQRFARVLDWEVIDPVAQRVRPLNDLTEVVDALVRPTLTRWLGPTPSITLSGVVFAIVMPVLAYAMLRGIGLHPWMCVLLVALFVSTTAYLSGFISYIRPAKRLSLVFALATLILASRWNRKPGTSSWTALLGTLFVSFFADEANLAMYGIVPLLYWRRFLGLRNVVTCVASYAVLPIVYLVVVVYALPLIYGMSDTGAWNTSSDQQKFTIFLSLFDVRLYQYGFAHVARALLTFVGVVRHYLLVEVLAVCVSLGLVVASMRAARRSPETAPDPSPLAAYLSIWIMGMFVTLIDSYMNFKVITTISYIASHMYYYHSILGVLILLFLGVCLRNLSSGREQSAPAYERLATFVGLYLVVLLLIASNFAGFRDVNSAIRVISTFPYPQEAIFRELRESQTELERSRRARPVRLRFRSDEAGMRAELDRALAVLFGPGDHTNLYYRTFTESVPASGFWQTKTLERLVRIHFPRAEFDVVIQK